MALDFSHNGYEGLFRDALRKGINLFCGAGFSVEASDYSDKKLPIGVALLNELKEEFPIVSQYTTLPRACTKLKKTDKEHFCAFLGQRFHVKQYNKLYDSLVNINVRNIYTTNIDDLFFRIFEESETKLYLNDGTQRGATYNDDHAVNYCPLHGCVRTNDDYVFGSMEIASAFSRSKGSWQNLANDAANHALLFWGWNFEDAGPIEAMYGNGDRTDDNTNRWVLLYNPSEETIDFLSSLNFNIIIGNTMDMLQYISDYVSSSHVGSEEGEIKAISSEMDQYRIPDNDKKLPSFPLKDLFLEYAPRWSHVYSNIIPKTIHYNRVANAISSGHNVMVIGIRGSGKTTLMMQLLVDYQSDIPKHYLIAPSEEQAKVYTKQLKGCQSILFVDDCFRDTGAIQYLLNQENITLVCFDRDFNYEMQYHRIREYSFDLIDITEIQKEDAQRIINIIPVELKKRQINMNRFDSDPTILSLLAGSIKSINFRFLDSFCEEDYDAARVFLMITYVHACGTPCSFDMIYSFLGDEDYTWKDMFDIINRAGKLINDITADMLSGNLVMEIQNYYECRSVVFAENVLNSIEKGNSLFAEVLNDFLNNVPVYKICMFDKFKKRAYDADYTYRAFPDLEEGELYYSACAKKDKSEYIYQQAALYFSRNKDFKRAFSWIDQCRNLMHYNRFSINSTYAQIYFDANIDIDSVQACKALDILSDCCENDKRKSIHFLAFAKRCIKYYMLYAADDTDAMEYIKLALSYISEGLEENNIAFSNKNKKELRRTQESLVEIIRSNQGI